MVNENIGVGEFLKECLSKCADSIKHPLRLLPILVIGAVWMVIGYYSSKMELPMWAKVVSFLSFAEGGLFGGVLGALGGIVGKVVMAVFVNSAILPLFEKKWPFVGVAGGLKGMFSDMGRETSRGIAPFLGGMGAALILYSFLNISQISLNSMVGIAAAVMLVQSIGNQGGFIFGLLFSIANSLTGGRVPSYLTISRLLTGMAVGFVVAVGLSFAHFPWCLVIGLPLLLLGLLLSIFLNRKKEEEEEESF